MREFVCERECVCERGSVCVHVQDFIKYCTLNYFPGPPIFLHFVVKIVEGQK